MSLLIQEPPLQVLPSLAVKLGLNDAIILQQIHYWLLRSNFEFDQKKWVYNTLKDWQKQFPFFSEDTIYRAFKRLEADGYLLSKMLSKNKFDRTKYYTIDYSKLNEPNTAFCADRKTAACDTPIPHFADISNTENTTETSITENTAENTKPAAPKKALAQIVVESRFDEFWQAYPPTDRRTAKKQCFEKWQKNNLDAQADLIIAHVDEMRRTEQWRNGFEPAALTYLNQQRWDGFGDGMLIPNRSNPENQNKVTMQHSKSDSEEQAKRIAKMLANKSVINNQEF